MTNSGRGGEGIFGRLKLPCTVHRELLLHLALKNLKIQYKYAFLGFLWAFFVPLCMALVLSFLFSILFERPTGPLPMVTALFVWQFVNVSIAGATTSIIDNAGIIKKVYFPREIVPLSVALSNFINFLLSIGVLVLLVVVYNLFKGFRPVVSPTFLLLPPLVILTFVFTAGFVLLTSRLQVFYRDVRYIVEIMLLVWFYFSGVFYEVDYVAKGAAAKGMPWVVTVFMLNPMYDIFTMYRAALLPATVTVEVSRYYPPWLMVVQTVAFSIVLFLFAYGSFMKRESEMADLI